MDDFELEIKRNFINEALMNLEEAEGSFMELEGSSNPKALLDRIFRLAHNLKGGSRAVGFGQVAEFTHQLENLVQKIQKDEVVLSSQVITTLLRSNDRLVEMLSELKGNFEASFDNSDLLADIQSWMDGRKAESVQAPVIAEPVEPVRVEPLQTAQPSEPEIPSAAAFFVEEAPTPAEPTVSSPTASPKSSESRGVAAKDGEIIRVSLERIDQLNDFVGELIVLQSVVQAQAADRDHAKLHSSLRQMVKLSKDIQALSMSLRMLPVKPLVQKLQRVVRDTATTLDKEVQFDVVGENMEMDKSVLDRLADPLIHILRNAVDHGLEAKEGRSKAGKAIQGKVSLSFAHEGNHLVVEVRDDGKGINGETLRKKAIEKGLVSEGIQLTEKQLINLIFHPGFSTKSEASEISGRGVGMDVVKTNVERVGGSVDVTTTVGHGSLFRLQIPLSLAVIDGLVVAAGSGRYVIPLSQVQETINLKSQKLFPGKLGIGSCIQLRGMVVPLFSLEECLGMKGEVSNLQGTILIVNIEDRPVGVVIHDILRAQQIVIKPLANGIVSQRGWVGSCVLGDGLPTLILSPQDMLDGKIKYELNEDELGGVA